MGNGGEGKTLKRGKVKEKKRSIKKERVKK